MPTSPIANEHYEVMYALFIINYNTSINISNWLHNVIFASNVYSHPKCYMLCRQLSSWPTDFVEVRCILFIINYNASINISNWLHDMIYFSNVYTYFEWYILSYKLPPWPSDLVYILATLITGSIYFCQKVY